ncbi:MAG: general stress protein CsbD [Chitinophagaceae bacterium]|nr:general stress protein CsbD [Chitinophagaceae bacterium]MBP8244608.1 general stress protein CsbD [Chitinophagaceae bacterium]
MNTTEQKGNWKRQKERLKQKFDSLTDDDLFFEAGEEEQMMKKLEQKLGKTKKEIQQIIAGM